MKVSCVSFLAITIEIWLELSPWMLLGAGVAGLMHVAVPAGWIRRQMSGKMGVVKATVIGVPLPLCSCGVIPVGLGLRKNGAGHGATVAFLISTPQTGVDSVLVSAAFLGWPFAILKVMIALITGLVGGMLAGSHDESTESAVAVNPEANDTGRDFWSAFSHGLQLIRSIWRWLVVGVLVSAAISCVTPAIELSQQPLCSGFAALLVTLVISLPLYVCATASVPIAAALVASGFPPGAALVFLMAGPATNLATLGAISSGLGRKSLMVYLTTIVGSSLLAGWAFNSVIFLAPSAVHIHDHPVMWWNILCGILLAMIVTGLAIQEIRKVIRQRKGTPDPASAVFVELGGREH